VRRWSCHLWGACCLFNPSSIVWKY
jgi:hypothetical protein